MTMSVSADYNERLCQILGVKNVVSIGFGEPGEFQPVTVIMELTEKQRRQIEDLRRGDKVEVCCGDYQNCTKACAPRADYWKEKYHRVELAVKGE
jgi:hypothetical protein